MEFYRPISIVLLFVLISTVYGEHNPDSEVESLKSTDSDKELKNRLEDIAKEAKQIRDLLEATKNKLADGSDSESNIRKLIEELPRKIANLTKELKTTIVALEKKELLA